MNLGICHTIILDKLKELTTIGVITCENENYTAANRVNWVRFTLQPIETEIATVGRNPVTRLSGLAMIDVFAPRGGGYVNTQARAEAVVSAFDPGILTDTNENKVHIISAWSEQMVEEATWVKVPVFVRWMAHRHISN